MNRRWVIIILTVFASAAILYFKSLQPPPTSSNSLSSPAPQNAKLALYLFHNPRDEDEECRKIYEFANRAERELSDKVTVQRPNIDRESSLLNRYSIRVLPTILIISADGKEKARFEGEGDSVTSALSKEFEKLKSQHDGR